MTVCDTQVKVRKSPLGKSLGWVRECREVVRKAQTERLVLGLLGGLLSQQGTHWVMTQSQELWKPKGSQRE